MTDRAFTTEERLQLDAAVRDITAGTQRIDEFCASLREDMVSNAAERRRIAVNKLSYVVANLEPTAISGTQGNSSLVLSVDLYRLFSVQNILIFLAERLSDTGHLSELLVTAIHHLYFAKKFEQSLEFDRLFHLLFDDNAVQSFVQADRMRFLEIFEDWCETRASSSSPSTRMRRPASGDPRCLLLAFRVFAALMERVDLGPMMEDMFELVACYYPLEYSPKRSDSSAISTSTLATACERCLLASDAFSFYTYQLIAEKMLDEETVVKYERKLEICRFLEDACARFGAPALIPLLDNFLPAFRMIALNPNQKSRDRRPVEDGRQLSGRRHPHTRRFDGCGREVRHLECGLRNDRK
ncbi:MMS19 nucleotide excision repair protein [Aphelenchoides fujianensis]|nr:MMS19 nucleotide excision repair protein [Aphelenchoides fujianensis]